MDSKLITKHLPWIHGQTINASAGALATTALIADSIPAQPNRIILPTSFNLIDLRFLGDTNNLTGTARIYAARKSINGGINPDLVLVASLALTVGQQPATRNGTALYYVDTIVVTSTWYKAALTADNAGADRMARVGFDTCGYDIFFALIEYTDTHEWHVEYSGF